MRKMRNLVLHLRKYSLLLSHFLSVLSLLSVVKILERTADSPKWIMHLTKYITHFFLFLIFGVQIIFPLRSLAQEPLPNFEGNLMQDLLIVDWVNKKLNDKPPVYYNHYQQGGYFNMPSARVGEEGEIGFGYSSVPPYRNWSARCQIYNHIELAGSYRVFTDILDPVLGQSGFGEFSDKGLNVKIAFLHPEDSNYTLPGFAIGFDDIMGTRSFKGYYGVFTQVFPDANLELSLGYGGQRYHRVFGGAMWMPFRKSCYEYLKPLGLVLEYDATDYKHDPHPNGRNFNTRFNPGIKYRLCEYFDFSLASVRGKELAWSVSTYYNFGYTCGFLPKIDDPLPYLTPVNTQPLGLLRTEQQLAFDLVYPFRVQGFDILSIWLSHDGCGNKILRIKIYNWKFREELEVKNRLNKLLGGLIPSDISQVYVVIEGEGFPVQEYHYRMEFVRSYAEGCMGDHELDLLIPTYEVSHPDPCCSQLLFKQDRAFWCYDLLPKTQTFFGSSTGKFKYALGINAGFHGFVKPEVYYQALFGYTFYSSIGNITDIDRLNPSQLINVHTCYPNYYKRHGMTIDKLFIQKGWNTGKGLYWRGALGYYDMVYGGAVGEVLYYPVNCNWAIGFEGSVLGKRDLHGLGFTGKIRKLNGFTPTYVNFIGTQYYLDLYYDWKMAQLELKCSVGQFMAKDFGTRFEITRYFPSGLKISLWYTPTNAHDVINGQIYHDKGFSISMPLDIFYTESSREKWGYGMSAWLRDCGYRAPTGKRLYETIHDQRQ